MVENDRFCLTRGDTCLADWIGYRWLSTRYGLPLTQALRVETAIGPTRAKVTDGTIGGRAARIPHDIGGMHLGNDFGRFEPHGLRWEHLVLE